MRRGAREQEEREDEEDERKPGSVTATHEEKRSTGEGSVGARHEKNWTR